MGVKSPTPVRALAPIPGICPIYTRSTMLYNRLTTCATTAGIASEARSFVIFPSPRFLVILLFFILNLLVLFNCQMSFSHILTINLFNYNIINHLHSIQIFICLRNFHKYTHYKSCHSFTIKWQLLYDIFIIIIYFVL